jgi:hypothetical protein
VRCGAHTLVKPCRGFRGLVRNSLRSSLYPMRLPVTRGQGESASQ